MTHSVPDDCECTLRAATLLGVCFSLILCRDVCQTSANFRHLRYFSLPLLLVCHSPFVLHCWMPAHSSVASSLACNCIHATLSLLLSSAPSSSMFANTSFSSNQQPSCSICCVCQQELVACVKWNVHEGIEPASACFDVGPARETQSLVSCLEP